MNSLIGDIEIFVGAAQKQAWAASGKNFCTWGFMARGDGTEQFITINGSGAPATTIERAQLNGVLLAAKWAKKFKNIDQKVYIFTPYEKLSQNYGSELKSWPKRGWYTYYGERIHNEDLWSEIIQLTKRKDIFVCAPVTDVHNTWINKVNEYAKEAVAAYQKTWKGEINNGQSII